MILLGFRDRLDRGDCGVDVRLNKETDFGLWQDPESDKIYAVMEAADGRQYVIVTVGGAGIGRFPNLRQVHGFQLASPEELDSFTANWTAYGVSAVAGGNVGQPGGAEPGSGYDTESSGISGSSSVIKAADEEVLIYNANNKDNIIFLEEEDRALVESVFGSALYTEGAAAEEILSYVVKTDECKYLFDWNGTGIQDVCDDGTTLQGFVLSQDGMELLKELYLRHGIYEE